MISSTIDRSRDTLVYSDPEGKIMGWPLRMVEALGWKIDGIRLSVVGLPSFVLPSRKPEPAPHLNGIQNRHARRAQAARR
jgi:hypothetical protein